MTNKNAKFSLIENTEPTYPLTQIFKPQRAQSLLLFFPQQPTRNLTGLTRLTGFILKKQNENAL